LVSQQSSPQPKFSQLAALFGLFYFFQGIGEPSDGLLAQPVKALLDARGETEGTIGTFFYLLWLPWAIKPLYGLISDSLPLAGYRRKSYLALAGAVSAGVFLALAARPTSIGDAELFWWLLPAATAVAFSDVVIDALMIERAQPQGWTGQMQSIQWTCLYGAGALAGWGGGYIAKNNLLRTGCLIVAVGGVLSLLLALLAKEDKSLAKRTSSKLMAAHLGAAWNMRVLRAAGAFLLLWAFNPFLSETVLYVHMRHALNFSDTFYGETVTWHSLAAMAGTACYGLLRTRVKDFRLLLHAAIVLGIASTIAYWDLSDEMSARTASMLVGFSGAIALLVQLDLVAQICPLEIAGTVFAVLMSLSNLSTGTSAWIGAKLYEHWHAAWGRQLAFNLLIAVGTATTAACWLIVPWLTREMNDHSSRT
jgi:BT1 family